MVSKEFKRNVTIAWNGWVGIFAAFMLYQLLTQGVSAFDPIIQGICIGLFLGRAFFLCVRDFFNALNQKEIDRVQNSIDS